MLSDNFLSSCDRCTASELTGGAIRVFRYVDDYLVLCGEKALFIVEEILLGVY